MKNVDRVTPPPAAAAGEMYPYRPARMLKSVSHQKSDASGTFAEILSALMAVDG